MRYRLPDDGLVDEMYVFLNQVDLGLQGFCIRELWRDARRLGRVRAATGSGHHVITGDVGGECCRRQCGVPGKRRKKIQRRGALSDSCVRESGSARNCGSAGERGTDDDTPLAT